jgi:hypothetical protein
MTATGTQLESLRSRHELLRLESEIREMELRAGDPRLSAIAETISRWSDVEFVDPREWRTDSFGRSRSGFLYADNRDDGRNEPLVTTELDLAEMRGVGRVLCDTNDHAIAVLEALTNYVVGNGYDYSLARRPHVPATFLDDSTLVVSQHFVDTFLRCWQFTRERESFRRGRRDGEGFVHVRDRRGRIEARFVEPDKVTEPSNARDLEAWLLNRFPELWQFAPFSWSFGVLTPEDDLELELGFFVEHSAGGSEWDFVFSDVAVELMPDLDVAEIMVHEKANVDLAIKRGISDFFPGFTRFDGTKRLVDNFLRSAGVQAAIALIVEHTDGVTREGIERMVAEKAAARVTTRNRFGSSFTDVSHVPAGSRFDTEKGTRYAAGPLAAQSQSVYVDLMQAGLRALASRWNMPEHVISSDASNNNYASILEAGSPFANAVVAGKAKQASTGERVVVSALRLGHRSRRIRTGLTWPEFRAACDVSVVAPEFETADKSAETTRNKTLHDAGILSAADWAAREGLDLDEQRAKGAKGAAPPAPPAPPGPASLPAMAESLVSTAIRAAIGSQRDPIALLVENCGTGDGGFKPGNDCPKATGGGKRKPAKYASGAKAEKELAGSADQWSEGTDYFDNRAVKAYAGTSNSFAINDCLRRKCGDARFVTQADELATAIDKATFPKEIEAYRSINPKDANERAAILEQFSANVGKEFVDPAFVSTTANKKYAETWSKNAKAEPINVTVVVPEGAKAAYLPKAVVGRQEWEVLIQRGSKFKVKSVDGGNVTLELSK